MTPHCDVHWSQKPPLVGLVCEGDILRRMGDTRIPLVPSVVMLVQHACYQIYFALT